MSPSLEILKPKIDLNVKHKLILIKCLDQNRRKSLGQGLGKIFLHMTLKTQSRKDF